MIRKAKDRFYIFKFTIYISRVNIATTFTTGIRLLWRSEHSLVESPPSPYVLANGQARVEEELTLEDILKLDAVENRFLPKQSTIVVNFVDQDLVQKAATYTVDLAELADGRDYNAVQTYRLSECIDQNAMISLALVHVSSFEIDETEAISFASVARLPQREFEQVQQVQQQEDLPPVFGVRERRAVTDQKQVSQDKPPTRLSPPGGRQTSQNKSVTGKRVPKSISPARSIASQKQQTEEYEKFMKLLQGKDELIQELQLKIEQLLLNKKTLQGKCKQLEQELQQMTNSYKMILAARDRLSTLPINTLPEKPSADFTSIRGRQITEADQRRRKSRSGSRSEEEESKIARSIGKSKQALRKLQTKESDQGKSDQYRVAMLQQENKMLKEEVQRSYQFQSEQKELIRELTQQLSQRPREGESSGLGKSLQEAKEQAKELQESLFQEKKKNILLEEQVNRLSNEVRRLDADLNQSRRKMQNNFPMASSKIFNQQSGIDHQLMQLRNMEIKNELLQMKKSSAPRINLAEERFRAIEEELKLKISQLREQADQKQNEYKKIVSEKQMEVSCLKDEMDLLSNQKNALQKKFQSTNETLSKQKEKAANNQRKIINYDRMERKLSEIEKYNKDIQADYAKCDQDRKEKNETIMQMKAKIQERQLEWTKLKRIEVEYKSLQQTNTRMNLMNERKERRLEDIERKVVRLKETMIKSDGKIDNRAIKDVEQQLRGKDKSEEVLRLEAERKALKDQSDKLNAKVAELENQVNSGLRTKDSIQIIQVQKAKLQRQISNDIETKLKNLESKLEQKRKSQRDEVQELFKSKMNFSDHRTKMLEQQNEQLRLFTKELTQKIMELELVKGEKQQAPNIAKKKEMEMRENQEKFEEEIEKISDDDLLKRSQVLDKNDIREYVERLRKAYVKRIEYLKSQLEGYQARETQMYEKEKDLEMEEIRSKTSDQIKKILKKGFESSGIDLNFLKERAKKVQIMEAQVKQLKDKLDRAEKQIDMKASLSKKSQYDESLVQELQRRDKDNRVRFHALQLQTQKIRFERESQKTEYQGSVKQLKKALAETKDSLQKQKISNMQQMKSIIEDYTLKEQQMKKFGQQYEEAMTILQREVMKREDELKDNSTKLTATLKQLEEIRAKYNDKVAISNQISQRAKEQQEQVKKLMEIIHDQDNQKALLFEEVENVKKQAQALFDDQKFKYEQLDENSKQQLLMMQQQMDRLQKLIEEEVSKSLVQEEENQKLKSQLETYKRSIEELYEAELNNEAAMEDLKTAQKTQLIQQRIIEEEYEKLLKEFGEKINELTEVKNKYVSLEILLARSEQFIKKLQTTAEKDRQQFQEIFTEMQSQKLALSNKFEQLTKAAAKKQQEYIEHSTMLADRQNELKMLVEQYKYQLDKEAAQKEQIIKEWEEVRDQNAKLREEAQVLKEMRKDNERRRGKRYLDAEPLSAMRPQKPSKSPYSRQDSKDNSRMMANNSELRSPMPRGPSETPHKDLFAVPERSDRRANLSPPNSNQGQRQSQLANIRAVTDTKSLNLIREQSHNSHNKNRSPSPPGLKIMEQPMQVSPPSNTTPNIMSRQPSNRQMKQPDEVSVIEEQIGRDALPTINEPPVLILDVPDMANPAPIHTDESQPREEIYSNEEEEEISDKDSYAELSEKVSMLQKELFEKKSMIAELEKDNTKLKEIYYEKIDKRTKVIGEGLMHAQEGEQGEFGASCVLQRGNNQEIIELKCKIKELEGEVAKEKADKQRYAQSIHTINDEYEKITKELQEMHEQLKERKRQLKIAQEKELEFIEEQRNAADIIQEKERYIAQFEDLVENYNKDKEGLQKMLKQLQAEFEQKMTAQARAKEDVERLKDQLNNRNDMIYELESKRSELSEKNEAITCEYSSCKSASQSRVSTLSSELKEALIQIKAKDQNLQDIAQRYVQLEANFEKAKQDYKKLEIRLQEKNHKYEQSLLKASSLEKEVNLALLTKKEFEQKIAEVTRQSKLKDAQKNKMIDEFITSLKRMEQEKESISKVVSERDSTIQQKDLENYTLKKDIEVFNSEVRKLKSINNDYVRELEVYEEQIKQIIQNYESELEAARTLAETTQLKNRELYDIVKQHEGQVVELQKIDRIRQDMFHELERKYKLLDQNYSTVHQKLAAEFNSKMAAAIRQLNTNHQAELQTKIEELQFLKGLYDEQQAETEKQRAVLFQRECELQKIKYQYLQERRDFEGKVKRYESEVLDLSDKFRQLERQRPTVELYEEIAFQNEIFKGRIAELEQNMTYKQQIGDSELLQEFEYFKAKKQREHDEFLAELENYSSQVNELEEKNYKLTQQLQSLKAVDYGRLQELEDENCKLEKELIRLEDSQEQLKRELKAVKTRRQQDFKRHYSQIQALRQQRV